MTCDQSFAAQRCDRRLRATDHLGQLIGRDGSSLLDQARHDGGLFLGKLEIVYLRRDAPRYTQARILEDFWTDALSEAIRRAADEMDQLPAVDTLTWDEVFEVEYDERLSG